MEHYKDLIQMHANGQLTDAALIYKILFHFGDRPSTYRDVEKQYLQEKFEGDQVSLEADAKWLAETF